MTLTQSRRLAALLPGGVPRWIRAYDNGGESADRFTVCYTGRAGTIRSADRYHVSALYRAMSADPYAPQGVGLFCESKDRHCDVSKAGFAPAMGRKCHLGKRIPFAALPEDCRRLVLSDYRELWRLPA